MSKTEKRNPSLSTILSLGIGAVLLVTAFIIHDGIGVFSVEMLRTILVTACAILVWVAQPVPIGVSSLFFIAMLPILGLKENLNASFSGMANAANYFVVASFGISIAMRKTTVLGKMIARLLNACKGKASRVVFAFMLVTYLVSMIMSDIAAVVISIGLCMDIISCLPEKDREKSGKVLMLAIPFASVIGGTATPAGSTVNVMALNLMEQNWGVSVSFLQWTLIGLPISVVLLFLAWFVICHIYHMSDISEDVVQTFVKDVESRKGSVRNEGVVLGIVVLMVVLWVAGSWITALNTTTVAIFGLLLMFMPGVQAFTWKEFKEGVPWEILLMGGATIAIGGLWQSTGLVDMLVGAFSGAFPSLNTFGFVLMIGVLTTLVLMLIPVGPTTVTMLIAPVYMMAESMGLNPVVAVVTLGIFASNCSILPLNSIFLLSYSKGYWKATDLFRLGIIITVCWIFVAAGWISLSAGWVF